MNLTIFSIDTHEPVLVLAEDDMGLSVVGGDPKYIQVLQLDRFKSLKEIADYINSVGEGFQAAFDGGADGNEEQPPAEMDDRIQPALDILKELLSTVKQRQDADTAKEEAEKPESSAVQLHNAEILMDPQNPIYVSLDGDNIGNAVARAEEKDDEATLADISGRINSGQEVLKQWALRMAGKVIEQGGDEGLVKVPAQAMSQIEQLRADYAQAVGATCTVGVGKKISESTKARMLGKLKGKNRTEVYNDATPKELDLRLKDADKTEANKIRTAMSEPFQGQEPGDAQRIAPQQDEEQAQPEQQAQAQPEQQQEAAPTEAPPQEQGEDPTAGTKLSPELLAGLRETKEKRKPRSQRGNAHHDAEIEKADYSYSEDPEFSKALRYITKHGVD